MSRITPPAAVLVLLALTAVSAAIWFQARQADGAEISYSRFARELNANQVQSTVVTGRKAVLRMRDGQRFRVTLPYVDPQLADEIAEHSEATFSDDPVLSTAELVLGVIGAAIAALLAFNLRALRANLAELRGNAPAALQRPRPTREASEDDSRQGNL